MFTGKLPNSLADDFNWERYNDYYKQEIIDSEKVNTLKLKPGNYSFNNNELIKSSDILPLHPNHRLLYETIYLLKPHSVAEIGFGGGDHILNLNLLLPGIQVLGYDRSIKQLNFALQRSPQLKDIIREFDITMPFSSKLAQVDIAYTQAVLMHIKTGNGHLVGLSNMFRMANKQVVLMENWNKHSFLDDIKFLFEQGMIPWKEIYFYVRRSPEYQNRPHLMIISSEMLAFEPLEAYSQLTGRD
jgi:hypothetical protein